MMERPLRVLSTLLVICLIIGACSSEAPPLPSDLSPDAVHALLTGPDGEKFLESISTHPWDDQGAAASELFAWIEADAEAADSASATRAGEAASSLAHFLADNADELRDVETGFMGRHHESVGRINPKLVQAFGQALTPFQGKLVCDDTDTSGFEMLDSSCDAAVLKASPVFEVLDSDPETARAFSDAGSSRIDAYLQTYAKGDPAAAASSSASYLAYAGRLLGLMTVGAKSNDGANVPVATIDEEMAQARFLVAENLFAKGVKSNDLDEYLDSGRLMKPAAVRQHFGDTGYNAYTASLEQFLDANGNLTQILDRLLRQEYDAVVENS